jgi:nitroimidazol reductase NimA-like FMN-containing flavoprotein (pyridoxamine 5'-phosphate oxidase superfamily)
MLGELNEKQIEELLSQQITGRLACYADEQLYLVPINYVYKDSCIYGHSAFGKKIEMMRKNPDVCFEVDEIKSIFNWKSVVTWGRFEEIIDIDEQQRAMQNLIHRIMPLSENPLNHPSHGITENEADIGNKIELVVYKIIVTKKTGRFENDKQVSI